MCEFSSPLLFMGLGPTHGERRVAALERPGRPGACGLFVIALRNEGREPRDTGIR